MSLNSDDDLLAMRDFNPDMNALYDNVPDALIIGMTRRCFAQLSRRRLIDNEQHIELLTILSRAIDNAVDANEALNRANAILRGDV